jgi:hypothetical protein
MRGRWSDPSAFRADPDAAAAVHPSRRQAIALLGVLVLVAGAVTVASFLIRPAKARAFDLFHGSVFLSDQNAPVAVDLASGKPTLRLFGADQQVNVTGNETLSVVPLQEHTLLLNESTGEFNMVDNSGFVVKHGGGVEIPRPGRSTSVGIPATSGEAYILRTGATGGTDVYLVSQATVESAMTAPRDVRARASGFMTERASTAPGGAASANGDLWLLVGGSGTRGRRTIRQLSVPAGSSAGAVLDPSDHDKVNGPAAIGTATMGADGGGATTVGVASNSRIDLFVAGEDKHVATFAGPRGFDAVLPTSNAQGRLDFLMHGADGWYLASVGADGTDLRVPKLVEGLSAGAALAEPAASNGRLYTIDKQTGALFQISPDGVAQPLAGRAQYPLATLDGDTVEPADFGDAYVIGRGPRVIFNSAIHANALVVFTDGSHQPRAITKSSAVTVSAGAGAEALTRSTAPAGHQPGKNGGPSKPQPAAVQPVNDKIDCKTATQKPHIPLITSEVPGSRSVALTWSYPVLDVQDCVPSTYVVSFKLMSTDAPQPPSSVRVSSQTGATISGLFPSTRYQVTVTAYINGQSTASLPVYIRTGEEGPAAPTNLAAVADSSGNWGLTWDSCGTVQEGCVAAQSWTITPNFCDGRGVSSPPPTSTVTADPTSKQQPPAIYKGTDDLLGRGLQFQVQGTGDAGQAGTPSAKTGCIYSWSPPIASAMSLQASTAPVPQLGQPTTATVTLELGSDPVRAQGGVGATFTYQLLSGGVVIKTLGPTTKTSVRFDGIRAGVGYQARAVVAAPRHPSATASVGPIDVETAHAPWPPISVTADDPVNQGAFRATVTVHISGLTSSDASGEKFDLTSDSGIYCGNTNQLANWDQSTAIDPADPLTFTVDRTQMFGSGCVVQVQLVQDPATGTEVFGAGTASRVATSNTFTVSAPDLTGVQDSDFSASWDGVAGGKSQIAVRYTGGNPLIGLFVHNWSVSVKYVDPNGTTTNCSDGYDGRNSLDDVSVYQSCVDSHGNSGRNWHVYVSFVYIGQGEGPFDVSPVAGGQAPTYNPPQCNLDPTQGGATLTATWAGTAASPAVQIDVDRPGQIADCGGWTYTIVGPTTVDCGTYTAAAAPGQSPQLAVTCTDTPADTGWSVTVTYTDPNQNNARQTYTITPIGGPVPS